MKYLVDTDWVAEYLVERDQAVTLLTQLAPDGLAISLMTYGEIYEGIYYGLQLVTRNLQDFGRIEGLSLYPLS